MLDRLSVPRRALDFEDYVDIVRRNIRWLIGPAFAGIVISTVVAFLMEDTFESKAMIRIVPQQISGTIVQNIAAQDVVDRIQSMAQTILSRQTLTSLITTYGLYRDELKREPMEDVISRMHDNIHIAPAIAVGNLQAGRSVPAMSIQFNYRDRIIASKVCNDLVARFMNTTSQDTLAAAESATNFMKDQYEGAKHTMDEADQKVQDYKIRHNGQLPEQEQQNMSAMAALEARLGSLTDAQTRSSEQQLMLQTQLNTAKSRVATLKSMGTQSVAKNQKMLETEKEIEDLQSSIASMKDKYTDQYPDLLAAEDRLAVLKKQKEEASKTLNTVADNSPEKNNSTRELMDAQAQVDSIQGAINANKLADSSIAKDIIKVNAQLRAFETRLNDAPAGEKDYMELVRDREVAKANYEKAEQDYQIAKKSLELERQKQGETLELLDAASVPTSPTQPKRSIYIPLGLVAGLVLGLIMVAIREVRDTSLKNLKDARLYTQLSILGSIPLLENDVVVQRRKQVMWVGWATGTILGLAVMAGSVAHYFLTKT